MRGALGVVMAVTLGGTLAHAGGGNLTSRENARVGAPRWEIASAAGHAIEGYASAVSVIAGGRLPLHVSTRPVARYRIEVYRLGWYGGAGARLVACVPSCEGSRRGSARALPKPAAQTGEVLAHWPVTDTIRTRTDWVSGEYLAQLVLVGKHRGRVGSTIPFVVRPSGEMRRAILVEVPVNTWEAYNDWGGKSLYAYNSTGGVAAVKVSFDRPWSADGDPNVTFPVQFEYPMLRFLERSGFPLEYVTDVDVDEHPGLLLEHRLSVTLGHSEYWSRAIRDAWDAARASAHDLGFLGANVGYWQMRYEDRHRTIVEYRSSTADPDPNPAEKTTTFRALAVPRPECELLGVEFQGGGLQQPLTNPYTVAATPNPWLAAAGLHPGDQLRGAVSGEWDAVRPGCGDPPPIVLLRYSGSYPADATLTSTASGGKVLALGTEGFGALLDGWGKPRCTVNIRAERFLRAALISLGGFRALPKASRACPSGHRER